MDINQKLCSELNIKDWQAKAVIDLIDEGNTIPFIARYRKEVTGGSWVNCGMAVMKKRISIWRKIGKT